MCGIYAKLGKSNRAECLKRLKKLEYRGYDAYGYSMNDGGNQYIRYRSTERINLNIPHESECINFIGHTRWASQGKNVITNTHPVVFRKNEPAAKCESDATKVWSVDKEKEIISIVCNGDIEYFGGFEENYLPNRNEHRINRTGCTSDVPIACDGLDQCFRKRDDCLLDALIEFKQRCEGNYAIVGTTNYYKQRGCTTPINWPVFAITNNMPLFYNQFGEISSDTICLGDDYKQITNEVILVYDGEFWEAILIEGAIAKVTNSSLKDGFAKEVEPTESIDALSINPIPTMLKEIREQSSKIKNKRINNPDINSYCKKHSLNKIHIYGCGSSYYAGMACVPAILKGFPDTRISDASDFLGPYDNKTLYVGITQSGHSKDVIDVVEELIDKKHHVWIITNNEKSYCANLVKPNVSFMGCGPEIAVAATKSFTFSVLTLLELFSSYNLESFDLDFIKIEESAKELSKMVAKYRNALFLGKGIGYSIALEGALKLKEVSYIHAEGMVAGSLKHGPIALIDNETISVFILGGEGVYFERMKLNLNQVKARKGKILGIGSKEKIDKVKDLLDYSLEIPVDQTSELDYNYYLACNIALQYLAHFTAEAKGLDSAFPRHLAKSLTVN